MHLLFSLILYHIIGNLVLREKFRHQSVPILIEGMIHRKGLVAAAACERHTPILKRDIDEGSADIQWGKSGLAPIQRISQIIGREHQDKLHRKGRMLSLDELETGRSESAKRKIVQIGQSFCRQFVCPIKFPVDVSVNLIRDGGTDGCFG